MWTIVKLAQCVHLFAFSCFSIVIAMLNLQIDGMILWKGAQ
jgi:hypothetical protein